MTAHPEQSPDILLNLLGRHAVLNRYLDETDILIPCNAPLVGVERYHNDVILIGAHGTLSFGLQYSDHLTGNFTAGRTAATGCVAAVLARAAARTACADCARIAAAIQANLLSDGILAAEELLNHSFPDYTNRCATARFAFCELPSRLDSPVRNSEIRMVAACYLSRRILVSKDSLAGLSRHERGVQPNR